MNVAWRPVLLFALTALLLSTSCQSGARTVAVEFEDDRGQPTRIPDDTTRVTIAVVCAPSNLTPCRVVTRQARGLAEQDITVVVVGARSSDMVVLSASPFDAAQTAALRAEGARVVGDVGGSLHNWLQLEPTGGAVVAADGDVLYRAERDASAERLVDEARSHVRMGRLWEAVPSPTVIILTLVGLLVAAALLAIVILRPRPFVSVPLTPGVPFALSGKTPRRRTSLWLKDALSLKSGEPFDPELWPEGLGVILDLRVTVDGRETYAGEMHVADAGPTGMKMFAMHTGNQHRATKLLLRLDVAKGAEIDVRGTARLGSDTVASHLELLLG